LTLNRKTLAIMISTRAGVEVSLAHGQPADLAAPVNDGRIEQPALLEVIGTTPLDLPGRRGNR